MRMAAIGAEIGLHLQHPHVDSHLQNLPAVAGFHEAGAHLPRLKLPALQQRVDIAWCGHGGVLSEADGQGGGSMQRCRDGT